MGEKVANLLGKKITIEELIKELGLELSSLKQVEIRKYGDIVKINGVIYGVYLGNGNVLTSDEKVGVCVIPVIPSMTFWRRNG